MSDFWKMMKETVQNRFKQQKNNGEIVAWHLFWNNATLNFLLNSKHFRSSYFHQALFHLVQKFTLKDDKQLGKHLNLSKQRFQCYMSHPEADLDC